MNDLLPCPFCGSKKVEVIKGVCVSWVYCPACNCSGPDKVNKEEAVEMWNRRVNVAETGE